ncbi:MAG: hypothetical protein HY319_16170 [Armatimonadetes bacterium]|nr:hypothetical protein [Armatimonadota bacterium]
MMITTGQIMGSRQVAQELKDRIRELQTQVEAARSDIDRNDVCLTQLREELPRLEASQHRAKIFAEGSFVAAAAGGLLCLADPTIGIPVLVGGIGGFVGGGLRALQQSGRVSDTENRIGSHERHTWTLHHRLETREVSLYSRRRRAILDMLSPEELAAAGRARI